MPDARAHTSHLWRSIGRMALGVVVLTAGLLCLPLRGGRWWLGLLLGVVAVAAIIPMTVHRFRVILRSDRPVYEAIEAAVLTVTMLITAFAAIYYSLDHTQEQFDGLETRLDAVYFTVTTLSTVGFGDIHATGQLARGIVTFQILVDLAFIGFAIRAFGIAARHRNEEHPLEIFRNLES